MNDHIVNALGVHKIYRTAKLEVRALNGVDLQVRRGEMVAIMGPSGCGKTTLLNCLAGLDDIDHGEVHLDGLDIHQLSDRRRSDHRSRKMGFIFQFFNLLPVLDAVENVEFPLLVAGVGPSEARRAAADMLDQVGLADRLDHKPAELSAGQQQRVAIARALVNDPIIVWGRRAHWQPGQRYLRRGDGPARPPQQRAGPDPGHGHPRRRRKREGAPRRTDERRQHPY